MPACSCWTVGPCCAELAACELQVRLPGQTTTRKSQFGDKGERPRWANQRLQTVKASLSKLKHTDQRTIWLEVRSVYGSAAVCSLWHQLVNCDGDMIHLALSSDCSHTEGFLNWFHICLCASSDHRHTLGQCSHTNANHSFLSTAPEGLPAWMPQQPHCLVFAPELINPANNALTIWLLLEGNALTCWHTTPATSEAILLV